MKIFKFLRFFCLVAVQAGNVRLMDALLAVLSMLNLPVNDFTVFNLKSQPHTQASAERSGVRNDLVSVEVVPMKNPVLPRKSAFKIGATGYMKAIISIGKLHKRCMLLQKKDSQNRTISV